MRLIGARYAWTAFAVLGVLVVLIGVLDLSSSAASSTVQENAINELFIGSVTLVVAVGGLRHGQGWAWYAMSLWPLWIIAQSVRAWSGGKQGEAISGIIFLLVALAALAVSYGQSLREEVHRPT